jgi:hypothetical protein
MIPVTESKILGTVQRSWAMFAMVSCCQNSCMGSERIENKICRNFWNHLFSRACFPEVMPPNGFCLGYFTGTICPWP